MATDSDKIKDAKEAYKCAKDAMSETHSRMLEDLRFSNPADPQQWDEKTRRAREMAVGGARPCLTFDQSNQYIAQVVNDSRQNKPSIQVVPVDDGADVEVAQTLEGMIRHIEYTSRAGIAYDTAQEYAARIGLGWIRILPEVVDPSTNEQEIRIKRVHDPLSVMLDPDSTEPDGSDAREGFVESSLPKRSFERQYPEAQALSWDSDAKDWFGNENVKICERLIKEERKRNTLIVQLGDGATQELSEDEYWNLVQTTGMRPPILAQFERAAFEVKWQKFSGSEILEETIYPSQWIGLIPVLGYELWIEGKRYICGMVRRMRDAQQAYNYERTSYIEQVALQPKSPWAVPWESIENFQSDWENANTSNAAFLPYNALDSEGRQLPPPARQGPPAIASAFVQGGALSLNDIQASIGMYRSNLGAPSNAVSGRAKMADKREGDTANFHYIDNLARSIEHAGRIIVDMIPRIYDTQRVAGIVGVDGSSGTVQIDPGMGAARARQQSALVINPNVGKYDVRVKVGPAYTTLREESAEAIGQILQGNPNALPILGAEWVRMQDWPNSDKIARMLLSLAPPEIQALEQENADISPEAQAQIMALKSQLQQMQQQLQAATMALETKAIEAGKEAKIERGKLAIDAFKAQTDRLKVTAPAMGPAEIQALVIQTVRDVLSAPPIPPEPMPSTPMPPQPGAAPIPATSGALPDDPLLSGVL